MGRQIKTEKAKRQRRQKDREGKKTEKAKRQRRQKDREGKKTEKARKTEKAKKNKLVYSEIFVSYNGRRTVTVQRTSWKYGRSALWIVTVPVSVQPC